MISPALMPDQVQAQEIPCRLAREDVDGHWDEPLERRRHRTAATTGRQRLLASPANRSPIFDATNCRENSVCCLNVEAAGNKDRLNRSLKPGINKQLNIKRKLEHY